MVRLFVPPPRIEGGQATLVAEDAAYLGKVLRLSPGDAVEVFDGAGGVYDGRITALSPTGGELSLLSRREGGAVRRRPVLELWPGLPKGEKLEWIVQKAVELGVAGVVPLLCDRSVPRLDGARRVSRLARWRKVAAEAARQCGRADIPAIADPADIAALAERARAGLPVAILHVAPAPGLATWLAGRSSVERVAIATGPEGGFAPEELATLQKGGASLCSIGRRTLRAETAAVTACAIWALAAGELG